MVRWAQVRLVMVGLLLGCSALNVAAQRALPVPSCLTALQVLEQTPAEIARLEAEAAAQPETIEGDGRVMILLHEIGGLKLGAAGAAAYLKAQGCLS